MVACFFIQSFTFRLLASYFYVRYTQIIWNTFSARTDTKIISTPIRKPIWWKKSHGNYYSCLQYSPENVLNSQYKRQSGKFRAPRVKWEQNKVDYTQQYRAEEVSKTLEISWFGSGFCWFTFVAGGLRFDNQFIEWDLCDIQTPKTYEYEPIHTQFKCQQVRFLSCIFRGERVFSVRQQYKAAQKWSESFA